MTPKVRNFEVEQILSDHPHQRHEFSFTFDDNEFKGHFYKGEITWMHPYPKQILDEEKEAKIENKIHVLLGELGVSSWIEDIEMTQVFEDRPHERRQVTLKVKGHEFKGFVHEGEIPWFHPYPKKGLKVSMLKQLKQRFMKKERIFSKGDNVGN